MQPTTPEGWNAFNSAYATLKDFTLPDQVVATAWCLGAALSAMREQARLSALPDQWAAFDRTAAETLAFLQREIATMRLPPPR